MRVMMGRSKEGAVGEEEELEEEIEGEGEVEG